MELNKKFQYIAAFLSPVFFLLLPVFFVLHGIREHRGFVTLKDSLPLLGIYMIAALALYALCWFLFRNPIKAALGCFTLMCFHFFFGAFHDLLKSWFGTSFITKYSFLLPALLVLLVFIFYRIKKTKKLLQRTSLYLNVLLIFLVVFETLSLVLPAKKPLTDAVRFPSCDTCTKPDIYLVVLDEYAGHQALQDLFDFDNSEFEQQLRQRGFHVVNHSRSNYNYTPFSMASMLNMEYLELKNTDRDKPDLNHAFYMINRNDVQHQLEANGYVFYNHSVFNLPGRPAPIEETFIPAKTRLFTSQTLTSRLYRDLGYHLAITLKIKSVIEDNAYHELRNNTRLYDLTRQIATTTSAQPRFVYTHLMMPHYPYYFDRTGSAMDPNRVLPEANNVNRKDYTEYLQYTNQKILSLADHLLKSSAKPPVIIVISDHGFRHFREPVEQKYHFMNLNAVYLPGGNYEGFYDSVSNVNQFRILFNSLFKTQYPILRDSSIYLKD